LSPTIQCASPSHHRSSLRSSSAIARRPYSIPCRAWPENAAAIASSEQAFFPTQVDVVLPVPRPVPEEFSPLVYCLAGELLAYYLAEVRGAEFFQATRSFRGSGERLRDSHTLRHPDELELLAEEAGL